MAEHVRVVEVSPRDGLQNEAAFVATADKLELIRRLKAQGVAVILISHRMPDVFAVCDRIIVLRRGTKVADKVTAMTSPEEITGLITGAILAA